MSGLRSTSDLPGGTPAAFVIAWQARRAATSRRADWIEDTRRRHEMPSIVDIAKRPDTLDRLSRILHP